jgi:hypothetical protein
MILGVPMAVHSQVDCSGTSHLTGHCTALDLEQVEDRSGLGDQ